MRFKLKDTFGICWSKQKKITISGKSAKNKMKTDQQSGRHFKESEKKRMGKKFKNSSGLNVADGFFCLLQPTANT